MTTGVLISALLTIFVLQPAEPVTDPMQALRFMSGSWAGESAGERFEEVWTPPDSGSMLGVGRTIRGGRTVSFEFLRIVEQNAQVVYHASPNGREPTPFTLIETSPNRAVFANPQHDFPQRLVYELEGNDMTVSIEGQGRIIRLRLRRAGTQ